MRKATMILPLKDFYAAVEVLPLVPLAAETERRESSLAALFYLPPPDLFG